MTLLINKRDFHIGGRGFANVADGESAFLNTGDNDGSEEIVLDRRVNRAAKLRRNGCEETQAGHFRTGRPHHAKDTP